VEPESKKQYSNSKFSKFLNQPLTIVLDHGLTKEKLITKHHSKELRIVAYKNYCHLLLNTHRGADLLKPSNYFGEGCLKMNSRITVLGQYDKIIFVANE
jgi:hypothetical protein